MRRDLAEDLTPGFIVLRRFNFFLLFLLALLQCLVPLLHAHAGGLHLSSHIHLPAELPLHSAPAKTPEFRPDGCAATVVAAVQEFKRDAADTNGAAPVQPVRPNPPTFRRDREFSQSQVWHPAFRSTPPPAQAPPLKHFLS